MTDPPHSDGPDGGHPGPGQPAPQPWGGPEQAPGRSPWDAPSEDDAGPGATRPYGRPPFGAPPHGQQHGAAPYGPPPGRLAPQQGQQHGQAPYAPQPYGRSPQGVPGPGQPPYGQPAHGQPGSGQPPYGQPPQPMPGYGAPRHRQGSRSRTGLLVGLVALLALVVVGVVLALTTGPTMLSRSAVEQDVAEQFEQREGVAIDLECAEEMTVEAGATYECTGVTADDEEVTLQIRITDEDGGRYTWSEP